MEKIVINTEYIKLDSFLKYVSVVSSGAEAKLFILDGLVKVNEEVETRRGRKIRKDDIISFGENKYLVV